MTIPVAEFRTVIEILTHALHRAPVVDVGEWQAIQNADMPQAKTIEAEDISFAIQIPGSVEELERVIQPSPGWAEEHFQERVSGVPHNPPPSHVRWPYAQANNAEHTDGGKFSHTYPERFWPKYASDDAFEPLGGIRYPWGDLQDVVELLRRRVGTRQAYLPVWFPEDTGAVYDQRVPCTLGYHFLIRNGRLKVVYYIRSCDFYRHFRDDVYMAARLGQWVAEKVGVIPDRLVMHISSLHVFEPERKRLETDLGVIRYNESDVIAPV